MVFCEVGFGFDIMGFSSSKVLHVLFIVHRSQAYKQGMHGPKYVWLLKTGRYPAQWLDQPDADCTVEEVKQGAGGFLGTKQQMIADSRNLTVAGKVSWRN